MDDVIFDHIFKALWFKSCIVVKTWNSSSLLHIECKTGGDEELRWLDGIKLMQIKLLTIVP